MDSRDSLVASGSSYYVQHLPTTQPSASPAFPLAGVDAGFSFQMGPNPHIGQGLHVETEPPPMSQQHTAGAAAAIVNQDDQVKKKKRGRPRKYKPDGAVTLGLSPSASTPPSSSSALVTVPTTPGSGGPSEKRRGRPPGSGKMQQLASLGKCFLGSVGTGFTPHVIIIPSGEDVAARIMSFSQQGPRAVCIMSATGAVSTATLHQDASSGSVVTYEGRFEILCLSGSYLVIDDGGSRTRNGGLCIALCGADHRVIGGSVGGVLTAAGTVQVIVGSFMYAGSKKNNKGKAEQEEETDEANGDGEEETQSMMAMPHDGGEEETRSMMAMPHDDLSSHSMMSGWPSMMRQMDSRSCNIDINSIRE